MREEKWLKEKTAELEEISPYSEQQFMDEAPDFEKDLFLAPIYADFSV